MRRRLLAFFLIGVVSTTPGCLACQTTEPERKDEATSPERADSLEDRPVEDCRRLLEETTRDFDRAQLPARADGPIGRAAGEPVTADQFHRFLAWFYGSNRPVVSQASRETLIRQAVGLYAVRRRLDAAGATADPEQRTRLADRAREQFSSRSRYDRYLDAVGLRDDQLQVETCRVARLLDFARSRDAIDVPEGRVDDLLADRGGEGTDGRRRRVRHDLLLRELHTYLADSSDEFSPLRAETEWSANASTTLQNVELQVDTRLGPADVWVEPTASKSGWRFSYPSQKFADTDIPKSTLEGLSLPVGSTVALPATSTDIARTLFVPKLGLRVVAFPGLSDDARVQIRADSGDSTAVEGYVFDFHRAPIARYTRGLVHFAVDDFRASRIATDSGERIALRLEHDSKPLTAERAPRELRLSARTPDRFAEHLRTTGRDYVDSGEDLYSEQCVMCHEMDGKGVNEFPPLAGSPALNGEWNASQVIRATLFGSEAEPVRNFRDEHRVMMPRTDNNLRPGQIARVVNYIGDAWGNEGPDVTRRNVLEAACSREVAWKSWSDNPCEGLDKK